MSNARSKFSIHSGHDLRHATLNRGSAETLFAISRIDDLEIPFAETDDGVDFSEPLE